jgi:hypothetical protein
VRENRVVKSSKIFFWERIAFRIVAGSLLPIFVSAYALYSVSATFTEVSETKERMQRTWTGIHLNENKAILTLTKMRMHAQAFQYEASQELARQLTGEAKDFTLDMSASRKSLESLASDNGFTLDTAIKKAYDDIARKYEEFESAVGRLVDASRRQNPTDAATARLELDRVAKEAETMIARLHAQTDNYEGTLSAHVALDEERENRTLVFYLVAVLLFGVASALVVTYSITSPVKKVVNRIRDIATGDGDLTKRVTTRAGGEMTELAQWLNVFLDKTHSAGTMPFSTAFFRILSPSMPRPSSEISMNTKFPRTKLFRRIVPMGFFPALRRSSGVSTPWSAELRMRWVMGSAMASTIFLSSSASPLAISSRISLSSFAARSFTTFGKRWNTWFTGTRRTPKTRPERERVNRESFETCRSTSKRKSAATRPRVSIFREFSRANSEGARARIPGK